MSRPWLMSLSDVEGWWCWFESKNYTIRLFRDDPAAAEDLKQRVDPMFWADEFVAGRLNGLIQEADETVLVQVREHKADKLPAGTVPVVIWPIPFEKGKRRRDRENLWKKVLSEFENHGLKDVPA